MQGGTGDIQATETRYGMAGMAGMAGQPCACCVYAVGTVGRCATSKAMGDGRRAMDLLPLLLAKGETD